MAVKTFPSILRGGLAGAALLGGCQVLNVLWIAVTTHRDRASARAAEAVRELGGQPLRFTIGLVGAVTLAGFLLGLFQAALRTWAGRRPAPRHDALHTGLLATLWLGRQALAHPALFAPTLPSPALFARVSAHLTPRLCAVALGLYVLAFIALAVRRRPRALVALLPLLAAFRPSPPPGSDARPNVLILGADSVRPDHLSAYGYPRQTTPQLDAFLRQGVGFDRALAALAGTTPSWVSMLTGTYPHVHGIRHMFPDRRLRARSLDTVVRSADRAGYRTAVVSDYAGDFFPIFDLGFRESLVPPPLNLALVAERGLLERSPLALAFLEPLPEGVRPRAYRHLVTAADPERLADEVIDAIHRPGPFFVAAFFSTTHVPFSSPYPHYRRWADPAYGGAQRFSYDVGSLADLRRAESALGARDVRQVVDLYDGSLAAVDAAMGRVLRQLAADGLDRNTVVVVLSDHGENLFEPGQTTLHGRWFRGGDIANRVPLIFRGPGIPAGVRVGAPVSLVDLAPTLCELLRWRCPADMEGRSLVPGFRGTLAPLPVFAETGLWLNGGADREGMRYPPIMELLDANADDGGQLALLPRFEDLVIRAKHRVVWDGRWKLTYEPTPDGVRYHLYDIEADPAQLHDLGATHPEAPRLRGLIRDWMARDPEHEFDAHDLLVRRNER